MNEVIAVEEFKWNEALLLQTLGRVISKYFQPLLLAHLHRQIQQSKGLRIAGKLTKGQYPPYAGTPLDSSPAK